MGQLGGLYGMGGLSFDDDNKAVWAGDDSTLQSRMMDDPFLQGVQGYADVNQGDLMGDAYYQAMNSPEVMQNTLNSPLYSAMMGGMDEAERAILRNQAQTGGLRSGNMQDALARQASSLHNNALLTSYQNQLGGLQQGYNQAQGQRGAELGAMQQSYQNQLAGLQGLAQLPSNANAIANQQSGIGQTLAQGRVAGAQARTDATNTLLNAGGNAFAAFV